MISLTDKNIRSILIVRPGGIGDLILSTPAFTSLRESFPKAKIHLLTTLSSVPLFQSDPRLDSVISFSLPKIEHHPDAQQKDIERLTPILRQLDIDLVVDLRSSKFTSKITRATKARFRAGFSSVKKGFFNRFRYSIRSGQIAPSAHRVELARQMMRRMGIRCDCTPSVFIPDEDHQWARDFFTANGLDSSKVVAVQPGSTDPLKCWPVERFQEVVSLLRASGVNALVLGPKGQKQAEQLAALCGDEAVSAVGKTTLTQLAACLKRCDLFVGNDSGPMHMSCALGTPVIAIFASTDPRKYGPLGDGHQITTADASPGDVMDLIQQRIQSQELFTSLYS